MKVRRLLNDREVLFDAARCAYRFVSVSEGSLLVTTAEGQQKIFSPDALGCYVTHVGRTERGLARERLRSFWES